MSDEKIRILSHRNTPIVFHQDESEEIKAYWCKDPLERLKIDIQQAISEGFKLHGDLLTNQIPGHTFGPGGSEFQPIYEYKQIMMKEKG